MTKKLVIAGFGDTGLLVAIHLAKQFRVVGISAKPCLVSGQELGTRLTRPQLWQRDYLMPFRRYRQLDKVSTLHGTVTSLNPTSQVVSVQLADGSTRLEHYDALLIASGVSNGFWRNNKLEDMSSIEHQLSAYSAQLLQSTSIAIIGAGASGVSVAANLRRQFPGKTVHLFFSQAQPLPGYHPEVRNQIERQLDKLGVHLHSGHRAVMPVEFDCDSFTQDAINWSTGQAAFQADLCLWTVGKVKPNNQFIPAEMLDADGFVKVDSQLRVEGYDNIFCVGDIAASDSNRSSARNWGWRVVANNLRAWLQAKPEHMKEYKASANRWGSILGVQPDGLTVFQSDGSKVRFPLWAVKAILFPVIVRKLMYKGVRPQR